jgi:hypothetical protein
MNITPYAPTLSTPTVVNPPTEGLRRENNQREIITQVAGANPSAAEKGVASEKDRARSSAQNNEQIDFANLRKQAEIAAGTINEKNGSSGEHPQDSKDQHTEHQSTDSSQHDDNHDIEDAESQANEKIIRQLESRDKEVRIHERAHASVGGSATGSPSYSFDIGPDGKQYAVSGEVSVDLSTVPGDPQATIQKMQQVHAAALAPVSPSAQDIRVAANATQIILQAQSELLAQGTDKTTSNSSNIANSNSALKDDNNQRTSSDDFDTLINQTLHAQEAIAPNQTNLNDSPSSAKQTFEVQQRAQRVETFYHSVSQGYERPDKYQFEITA